MLIPQIPSLLLLREKKTRRPSTSMRHCSVRLLPIAENSPLLPPFKGTLPNLSLRWNKRPRRRVPSVGKCIFVLKAHLTDISSYLYCLSNPKTLIRGGVLQVGSDPIPVVKLLPTPAHLPLKLEYLYRGGQATQGIEKFEVGCGV
ncbi:hypothetical protein TIFTF001_039203 [Ficus carica]|uniref:Uncharacterized protein n=1 Tax=Ficus carica TaxID=3494 RepID=A0AA88JDP8_FICCA|nr:hypothetical protein TIFTF001_039203 [Ficus carica]